MEHKEVTEITEFSIFESFIGLDDFLPMKSSHFGPRAVFEFP